MALTPFRWIGIAVIGCLAVLLVVLREPDWIRAKRREAQETSLAAAAADSRLIAIRLGRIYEMSRIADSLRPLTARPDARPVRVTYSPAIATDLRTLIDSTVARGLERVGDLSRTGVDVVVLSDTSTAVRGASRGGPNTMNFYMLPAAAGQRCVSVLQLGREHRASLRRMLRGEEAAEQIFGPCAYYAAFGMPGPHVRSWLQKRGSLLALSGSWTRAPERPPQSRTNRDLYFSARHPALDYLSMRGTRCAAGDASTCEFLAMQPGPNSRLLSIGSTVSPMDYFGSLGWYRADLSGRETELLAGMVRSLGREKFGSFWRSNDSVKVAFERASGVPLGAWVVPWLTEYFGELRHGPGTSGISIVSAAVVVGLALFFGLRAARKREFA